MLELAIADYDDLLVDDREIRREGYSYMADTLAEIRAEEGEAPIVLMVGQDAVNHLDSWHEWRRLFGLAHLAVMRRPRSRHVYSGELFEELQPRLIQDPGLLLHEPCGHVLPLEVTQLEISSTGIRQQIRAGKSPRFLLPDPVIQYIHSRGLYAG